MKRQVYLELKTLDEARSLFLERVGRQRRTSPERVRADAALGRVTAEPVFARFSSPHQHVAAMDGIAVSAARTYGTTERDPRILEAHADYEWVNTGQVLPGGMDAVIMVEKVQGLEGERLEIRAPVHPWQHVRKVGEDLIATQLLFPQNHLLGPYDLGALISAGVFELTVWRRPRVAIIPTGSELVSFDQLSGGQAPQAQQILEFNSVVLSALVRECGGEPIRYPIVPDDEATIRATLQQAVDSDVDAVVVNAGSSAGSRDYTVHLIRELGEVLVHGVAMMPGKPTILGIVAGKPVLGNPGYPVSAAISFDQFLKPLLYSLQARPPAERRRLQVQPTRNIPSKLGTEEFLRVNLGEVRGHYVATPLPRGAGAVTTLTRAEGMIRIPPTKEGVTQDETVEAELFVEESELKNTVVIIGSHDITLDLMADLVRREGHTLRVSSASVGSLGGLLALRKGNCHVAGSHLLDPASGTYNVPYVKRYLPGLRVSLFHLVKREQGLIVARGNPKDIRTIGDLVREDVRFINRQAGSGTRVLLDYLLGQERIEAARIQGYAREEFTHMDVAVDVASGMADCGMGIYAAARALELDFIPLIQEQYDLVIPSEFVSDPRVQVLLETVRRSAYREAVTGLGGYDPALSGEPYTELGPERP